MMICCADDICRIKATRCFLLVFWLRELRGSASGRVSFGFVTADPAIIVFRTPTESLYFWFVAERRARKSRPSAVIEKATTRISDCVSPHRLDWFVCWLRAEHGWRMRQCASFAFGVPALLVCAEVMPCRPPDRACACMSVPAVTWFFFVAPTEPDITKIAMAACLSELFIPHLCWGSIFLVWAHIF